jgi:hypothetical protein
LETVEARGKGIHSYGKSLKRNGVGSTGKVLSMVVWEWEVEGGPVGAG